MEGSVEELTQFTNFEASGRGITSKTSTETVVIVRPVLMMSCCIN
jgi:hypothetical protein